MYKRQGIGFALAEFFGKKGHQVFGLSRKEANSEHFKTILTDITDNFQVQNAILEILKTHEKIDVLINNAGIGMVGSVEDSSQEEILKLFNLNLVGSVQMTVSYTHLDVYKSQVTILRISNEVSFSSLFIE